MKKIIIKTFILTLTVILCFASLNTYAWEYKYCGSDPITEISVVLDGRLLEFKTQPKFANGRTMVPVDELVEFLNGEIMYYENTSNQLNLDIRCPIKLQEPKHWVENIWMYFRGDQLVYDEISYDSFEKAASFGAKKELDAAPVLINDKVFVPLRPICEAMGYKIVWEQDTMYVHISTMHYKNYKPAYRKIQSLDRLGTYRCEAICDNRGRRVITIYIENEPCDNIFLGTENGEYLFFNNGADFKTEKTENGYISSITYIPSPDTHCIYFYPTIDGDVLAFRTPITLEWNRN